MLILIGETKLQVRVNIGLHGRKCVYLNMKEDWIFDACLMFLKQCMQNYGGDLGLKIPYSKFYVEQILQEEHSNFGGSQLWKNILNNRECIKKFL